MHAFELQRAISRVFADFDSYKPFLSAVAALAKSSEVMHEHLPWVAQGGEKLNQGAGRILAHLAQAHQTTATINNRQFFRALEHFQRSITQLQPSPTSRTQLISHLNEQIEQFAGLYDTFLSGQSGDRALPLILAAQNLQAQLEVFLDSLQLFEEAVGMNDIPNSAEAPLAIWLPSHLDLSDFARRLLALQSLYSELCMLLSVAEADHPLRISKIESGSLWARVFGESRVIGMMVNFVEQTASWIYRTYTSEGKLASVPRKIEAIDSLLGLTQRLQEAGLDTSEMQAHIEKSAVAISKDLAVLLDGQPSITVNEHVISIGTELSKGYLEGTMPLRLQGQRASNEEEPPSLPPPA